MPPSPIDYFSVFDGWGSGAEALRQLGVSIREHWASEHPEMNPWAVKTSQALNPKIKHLGPIESVNPGKFPCKPGLFTAGPPCQDVSIGTPNRQGLSGSRSMLFYPTADLWDALGNPHGWFESVASMTPQTRDAISNRLGISPVLLDAGHVGGVSRPRLFWPTFPVKPMEGQGVDPRELIDPARHLFDPFNEHRTYRLIEGTQGYEKNTSKLWKPMRGWDLPKARAWTRAYGAHGIPYDTVQLEPGGQIWRWTPNAGEMLHGIPEGTMAAAGAPWTEQKKMIGNGWDIPTVKHLIRAYMDHTQPGWDQPAAPQRDRIEIWTPQNNAPVSPAEPTVATKIVTPAPGSEMFQSSPQQVVQKAQSALSPDSDSKKFLADLQKVASRLQSQDTPVARFADIYKELYPTGSSRKATPPDVFAKKLLKLQLSGITSAEDGSLFRLEWPSGNVKNKDLFLTNAPDGKLLRYYGIQFTPPEPSSAPDSPVGIRSPRSTQRGYTPAITPIAVTGAMGNAAAMAASAYYDAIQHGATHDQAMTVAKQAGGMGLGFAGLSAIVPNTRLSPIEEERIRQYVRSLSNVTSGEPKVSGWFKSR